MMDKTCSQCSAFDPTSNVAGYCTAANCPPGYVQIVRLERANVCTLTTDGWNVEWNASMGLQWEYGTGTGSWWLCRSEVTIGRVMDRACSESGQYEAHTKSEVIATGTLHDCARALVDRVKGDR